MKALQAQWCKVLRSNSRDASLSTCYKPLCRSRPAARALPSERCTAVCIVVLEAAIARSCNGKGLRPAQFQSSYQLTVLLSELDHRCCKHKGSILPIIGTLGTASRPSLRLEPLVSAAKGLSW